ncbi:MAG: hypothetical protein A3D31_08810 [Candidatus Fluviicola riflensis]|nr:MAG: hypothetical protein CHH17_06185 [Candidatus Fluviicola riflensis]OGS80036.1 MAG: hypothetical protein A3D31_08810 [Candidatus Fluviicola riflensis]OGS82551.1 MAG: hypothetical protein A2724_17755 [Fluviicola sp. RIFCSPHIGHO2_01_FULL_43_53]OGS88215.1 MAG: hypothetical protein A3E30_15190 [Fluviicola sp. RIFCSPHIGHO2_12_FULL_43_24]
MPLPTDGSTIHTKTTCFLDRAPNLLNMSFIQRDGSLFLEIENNFKSKARRIVLDSVISIRFVFIDSSDYIIKMTQPEVKERTVEDHLFPFNTVGLPEELLARLAVLAIEQVIIENPYGTVEPEEKIVFSIPRGYQNRITKIADCFKRSLN